MGTTGGAKEPIVRFEHLLETTQNVTAYQLLEAIPVKFKYEHSVIYIYSLGTSTDTISYVIANYQFWHGGSTIKKASLNWGRGDITYNTVVLDGSFGKEAVNATLDADGRLHVPNQSNYYIAQNGCNVYMTEIPFNLDTGAIDLTKWGQVT